MNEYEAPIQESITLESFHLVSLDFNLEESNWENVLASKETEFRIKFNSLTNESKTDYFGVSFKVNLENPKTTFKLDFTFIGNFRVKGVEIKEDTMESHPFFRFSAPAIIFPYIRSFITSFTTNAGFTPVILPSINFSAASIIPKD